MEVQKTRFPSKTRSDLVRLAGGSIRLGLPLARVRQVMAFAAEEVIATIEDRYTLPAVLIRATEPRSLASIVALGPVQANWIVEWLLFDGVAQRNLVVVAFEFNGSAIVPIDFSSEPSIAS